MSNNWYVNFSKFEVSDDYSKVTLQISDEAKELPETQNLAVALLWESSLDFIPAGEDGCLNNFDMYSPIYNVNWNKLFLIPYSTADDFKEGKEVEIYGRSLEDSEIEEILSEYSN